MKNGIIIFLLIACIGFAVWKFSQKSEDEKKEDEKPKGKVNKLLEAVTPEKKPEPKPEPKVIVTPPPTFQNLQQEQKPLPLDVNSKIVQDEILKLGLDFYNTSEYLDFISKYEIGKKAYRFQFQ